jgi:glycosyltransferase involved in cell wall biosynthesis
MKNLRCNRTALGRRVAPPAGRLEPAGCASAPARSRPPDGGRPETVVLSCIGLRDPGRLQEHILGPARAAGASARSVLLDLGPGGLYVPRLAKNVELRATGYLPADELARRIAAGDVFLAPYTDGVSTRRGMVIAALQHGVAVAGTRGHLTDEIFARASRLQLAKSDCPGRFAASVARIVRDPDHRASLGAAGRRLYEMSFDWPVLARRLRGRLDV